MHRIYNLNEEPEGRTREPSKETIEGVEAILQVYEFKVIAAQQSLPKNIQDAIDSAPDLSSELKIDVSKEALKFLKRKKPWLDLKKWKETVKKNWSNHKKQINKHVTKKLKKYAKTDLEKTCHYLSATSVAVRHQQRVHDNPQRLSLLLKDIPFYHQLSELALSCLSQDADIDITTQIQAKLKQIIFQIAYHYDNRPKTKKLDKMSLAKFIRKVDGWFRSENEKKITDIAENTRTRAKKKKNANESEEEHEGEEEDTLTKKVIDISGYYPSNPDFRHRRLDRVNPGMEKELEPSFKQLHKTEVVKDLVLSLKQPHPSFELKFDHILTGPDYILGPLRTISNFQGRGDNGVFIGDQRPIEFTMTECNFATTFPYFPYVSRTQAYRGRYSNMSNKERSVTELFGEIQLTRFAIGDSGNNETTLENIDAYMQIINGLDMSKLQVLDLHLLSWRDDTNEYQVDEEEEEEEEELTDEIDKRVDSLVEKLLTEGQRLTSIRLYVHTNYGAVTKLLNGIRENINRFPNLQELSFSAYGIETETNQFYTRDNQRGNYIDDFQQAIASLKNRFRSVLAHPGINITISDPFGGNTNSGVVRGQLQEELMALQNQALNPQPNMVPPPPPPQERHRPIISARVGTPTQQRPPQVPMQHQQRQRPIQTQPPTNQVRNKRGRGDSDSTQREEFQGVNLPSKYRRTDPGSSSIPVNTSGVSNRPSNNPPFTPFSTFNPQPQQRQQQLDPRHGADPNTLFGRRRTTNPDGNELTATAPPTTPPTQGGGGEPVSPLSPISLIGDYEFFGDDLVGGGDVDITGGNVPINYEEDDNLIRPSLSSPGGNDDESDDEFGSGVFGFDR